MISYSVKKLQPDGTYADAPARGIPVGEFIAVREDQLGYVIDHIPTGTRIASFGNRDTAIAMAEVLAPRALWGKVTLPEGADKALVPQEIHDLVRALRNVSWDDALVALAELLKQEAA